MKISRLKFFSRTVLLLAGCLIGLVFAEALLRAFHFVRIPLGVPNTSGFAQFQESAGGSYYYSFNSQSYRSNDFILKKEIGEKRILFLGDSHGWGVGVDQNEIIPNRLADLMNASIRDRMVSVDSMALPQSSLNQYLKRLKEGLVYSPDFVVMLISSGNDFTEIDEDFDPHTTMEGLKRKFRRFHVYHAFAGVVNYIFRGEDKAIPGVLAHSNLALFIENVPGQNNPQSRQRLPEKEKTKWAIFRKRLRQIHQECLSANTPILVAVLPSKLQVDRKQAQKMVQPMADRLGINLNSLLEADLQIHHTIVQTVREEFHDVIDLRPTLKSRSPGEEKYFPVDAHLNRVGHAIVGEALAAYILAHPSLFQSDAEAGL